MSFHSVRTVRTGTLPLRGSLPCKDEESNGMGTRRTDERDPQQGEQRHDAADADQTSGQGAASALARYRTQREQRLDHRSSPEQAPETGA
jgi:hypothetical protein